MTRGVKSGEVRGAEHSKQWSAKRQHIRNPRKICGCSVYAISSEPQQITPTLLYGISYYSLIALPLIPKHVTLNDLESPFCLKFCFVPVCLELWSLAFEACNECCRRTKAKRTAAASGGFLATARLSCLFCYKLEHTSIVVILTLTEQWRTI